jgi:hypothetical protein
VNETAKRILDEQSPARLLEVRGRLYELITHCIPDCVIIKGLTTALIKSLDEQQKIEVAGLAAEYEHRLQRGSKAIFHLEAFVAKFMSVYKSYLLDLEQQMMWTHPLPTLWQLCTSNPNPTIHHTVHYTQDKIEETNPRKKHRREVSYNVDISCKLVGDRRGLPYFEVYQHDTSPHSLVVGLAELGDAIHCLRKLDGRHCRHDAEVVGGLKHLGWKAKDRLLLHKHLRELSVVLDRRELINVNPA